MDNIREKAGRVLKFQLGIGLLLGFGLMPFLGFAVSQSALYGAAIAVVNTLVLIWGVNRASAVAEESAQTSMAILYIVAAVRFVMVGLLFVVGLAVLGLVAPYVVLGFVAAYLGYLFGKDGRKYSRRF